MTICARCVHHLHAIKNTAAPEVWYNHVCLAPDVARDKGTDPVTGRSAYFQKNDLGRLVEADSPHPYCRDINHGNCPHYEEKAS